MKQTLQLVVFTLMLLLSSISNSNAQSKLIHYWHFNKNTTASIHINNLKADYSLLDTNKAIMKLQPFPGTVADTGYMDNYLPTAIGVDSPNINLNARMSTPTGVAVRVRNPSDSMELRFYIPTTGYQNILFKYMSESSSASSGQKVLAFDYSVDSGSTWKTTALTKTTDTTDPATFKMVSVPFSDALDTMVKNNAKLVLRIKFIGQNTGTSGNSRFDNVTVDGDTLTKTPPPSTAVATIANSLICTVFPNPAGNRININTPAEGNKAVAIYNVNGQKVFANNYTEKQVQVDVHTLNSGLYYINICTQAGETYSTRFFKN